MELATLRLTTLRRLLPRDRPLRAFTATASIGEVWRALSAGEVAAIVDDRGVLLGTASRADLAAGASDAPVETVMVCDAPMAEAELELADARELISRAHADRVLVIGEGGRVLGILAADELG